VKQFKQNLQDYCSDNSNEQEKDNDRSSHSESSDESLKRTSMQIS
jgi:hypothetical protein